MSEQNAPNFDTLLQQAARENFCRRIAAMPPEETLRVQYGDFSALDRRIYDSLKRLRKLRTHQNLPKRLSLRTVKRIALVAALLAAVFCGTLLVSADLRAYVKNIIVEWTERNVGIRYEVGGHTLTVLPEGYAPHYIPEGFAYVAEESYEYVESIEEYYENADGYFIMIDARIANNASAVWTDNEHITYKSINIGETDAYLGTFNDGDGYVMYWFANGIEHEIYINAYLPETEVLKIAENIY